jgi:hypothetical protein
MPRKKKAEPSDSPVLPAEGLRALDKLIGRPLVPEPRQPVTAAEKLALLLQRIHEQHNPPPNPYRESLTKFCTTMCYTVDEADGGKVKQMPDWEILREFDDAQLECTPLMVEKCRRALISWRACCADLWIVAGGYDPRWPALMPSKENPNGGNRKVIIAAKKAEGESGSWDYLLRIKFIYEEMGRRGLRELWPDFPELVGVKVDRLTFSNNGVISAVPQGEDNVRGAGITRIHAEELSTWDQARGTMATALQTLRPHGKLVAITNARASTYAADVYYERLRFRAGGA